MKLYQKYCKETVDAAGRLTAFELVYPPDFNFGYDVVDAIAAARPDKVALVWCDTSGAEKVLTFGEVKDLSDRAAQVFLSNGISKGDMVMVMLKRRWEYWVTAVALAKIGAVLAPVTHKLTEEDIAYRLSTAHMKAVLSVETDDAPARVAAGIALSGETGCKLFTLDTERQAEKPADAVNFTKELAAAAPITARHKTAAEEPMLAYFTSGTTGHPKGVLHNHIYPLAHIPTAAYWQRVREDGLHFTVAETGWAKSSWGKIYGQWLAGSAVMVYDFDNFDPRGLMHVINRYGVTTFCAPPTIYRYMVKTGVSAMPSLEHATTAGEALNPEVSDRFREATGLAIHEGYGQTESVAILANFRGQAVKPGSMGLPNPVYQVSIQKLDGAPAPVGEPGEIVIHPKADGGSPDGLFYDYFGDHALYEAVWEGGVYHTGDVAYADEDGYFWFQGRADDIIKTGGYRVGPFEIENVLMEHPAVMECSVVGVPDKLRGQAIKAVVALAPGTEPTPALAKEIKDFTNKRVADYKWIRQLEFVEEMPKTVSGKIKKKDQR
ncbi:MAG: AMP-binding protein [Clostridiales Family XIII bacterium]|jgi:acetyl-CoA synthetase|nr:AMP-binding protein [Clostridiales Family XIII bacterium]